MSRSAATIFVVDDDASVRRSLSRLLRSAGHAVETFASAAADLGIAEKTVKVHRARVMEKMRVQSLAELVRLAEGAGFFRDAER